MNSDTARARAFEVVGPDGRPRARLGLRDDGSLALDLADANGVVRATLGIGPDGSVALGLRYDQAGMFIAAGAVAIVASHEARIAALEAA